MTNADGARETRDETEALTVLLEKAGDGTTDYFIEIRQSDLAALLARLEEAEEDLARCAADTTAVDLRQDIEFLKAEHAHALRSLADEAARAVTEPRRFHENEDGWQQALGRAVSKARLLANSLDDPLGLLGNDEPS